MSTVDSDVIRVGSGAGFSGDRIEPAVELLARGELDVLVLECLAERTIALGQRRKLADPSSGYDPMLERRLEALLPGAVAGGVRMITNMGAANPLAAGAVARSISERVGLEARIGVVSGDDVLDRLDLSTPALEDGLPLEAHGPVVSANAYLGADAVLPALDAGCQLVITGRVADPSLFLAPLAHRFGWNLHDPLASAAGTLVGHLLECAGQLSGGYFADGGRKRVPGLADLGFPFADVDRSGRATYSKLRAPVARSPAPPCASNCSTKSPTRPPTSRRTSSWTCAEPESSTTAATVSWSRAHGVPGAQTS